MNDGEVDGIKNNDSVAAHPQRGCGVNPMACPACSAQFWEDFAGVIPTLRSHDDVATFELIDVKRIFKHGFVLCLGWGFASCVGGREKQGFNEIEVTFSLHAIH